MASNISKQFKLSLTILLFAVSCKKAVIDPIVDPIDGKEPVVQNPILANAEVNNWIYNKMNEYYFWEAEMKSISETDLALEPAAYFESLLVQPGEVDRFSWIDESSENLKNSLNGLNSVYGFKYKPFYANAARTRIAYAITYSLKNSAAERAEIKRGDFITKVNGQELTPANYRDALNTETVSLTLGTYNAGVIEDTETVVSLTKEVTQTEALQYDTILELGGKKIGYFVYTQFLTTSDKEVNNMFGRFKLEGIDELVVDFRYNPGGYISSAEIISSLIVKNLNTSNLMTRQVWNAEQNGKRSTSELETNFLSEAKGVGPLNNISNLNRVYFLVSNGSASASELVINNLKPYMEVILVGEHTYGKNVGSITIDDDEDPKRWTYGMQPIVLKSFNAAGESDYGTKTGFMPDFEVVDNFLPYKSFGDPDESLLKVALEDILGTGVLAQLRKGKKVAPTKEFQALENIAIYGNEFLDRKDMWVTEYP